MTYRRESTFDVFAQGFRDLQGAYPDIEFECLVVGSGDRKMVEKHGFEYHDFPNDLLSAKAQHRLSLCKDRADYYLFLGSDDIIRPDTFQYYLDNLTDFMAPLDICFYHNENLYYSPGYNKYHKRYGEGLAVGRMVSNELLERVDWELWTTDRVKNIDYEAFHKLKEHSESPHFFSLQNIQGLILDIKTHDNISKFDPNRFYKIGDPEEYLSDKMVELLKLCIDETPDATPDESTNIHPSAVIYPNVYLGKNVRIEAGTVIGVPGMVRGESEFYGEVYIGDDCVIGANVTIAVGTNGETRIGKGCLIMNNALVGHNVKIGDHCEIGGGCNVAGHAELGDKVILKTGVTVRNRVEIWSGITVGQGSNVVETLGPQGGTIYVGNPCERILESKPIENEHGANIENG